MIDCNDDLFFVVCVVIFGGVNFLVCVYGLVGGMFWFFVFVKGVIVMDVVGCEYVDFVVLWGFVLFGYVYLEIVVVV